ncbi:MAG TPA: hypothetical protein VLI67_10805, partial [Vicinamibacteria bacterium]|nr:hypothetical protein [Vicinamibacteria bacterium]
MGMPLPEVREDARGDHRRDQLEVGLVVEAPVAAADHRPAVALHVPGEPDPGGEVVAVDRVRVRIAELGFVALLDRQRLAVVAQPEAQGQAPVELPLVLDEGAEVVGPHVEERLAGDADLEPLGIGREVAGHERDVARVVEGPVSVVLARRRRGGVLVL